MTDRYYDWTYIVCPPPGVSIYQAAAWWMRKAHNGEVRDGALCFRRKPAGRFEQGLPEGSNFWVSPYVAHVWLRSQIEAEVKREGTESIGFRLQNNHVIFGTSERDVDFLQDIFPSILCTTTPGGQQYLNQTYLGCFDGYDAPFYDGIIELCFVNGDGEEGLSYIKEVAEALAGVNADLPFFIVPNGQEIIATIKQERLERRKASSLIQRSKRPYRV